MRTRIFCAVLLLLPAIALAGVNTKNGNFYISYTDLVKESGGRELQLTRVYNSQTTKVGWFGFGWGSTFETSLMVMPDGSVVANEAGSGQANYYAPVDGIGLQAGVDKIVAVAIERDKLEPDEADMLRKNLLADENLRRTNVAKYGIQSQLPDGGAAQSSACAAVTRIHDEYRRTTCGQRVDYFDLEGRLIRKEEGGYKITLHYAGKYPDRIEDSLGQRLFLMWTAAGHVAEARADKDGKTLRYFYDEKDNLLLADELGGNYYKYEYDSEHNLTRIGYIDNTHMDMQYGEKSFITSVTEPDGSKNTYAYRYDPKNPASHYWATTTRISATGEQSGREEEFSLATNAAGIERIAGLTSTEGDRKQDIALDELGRIKRIQKTDGRFTEYTYHPTFNKVSAVLTEDGNAEFQYSKAGDLILAKNSRGQSIKLDYDSKKHVVRMIETDKSRRSRRELTFKYNNLFDKPSQIKLVGKGEINVEYGELGEILKVESKQGAKMAMEVSQAFQALLSVVKVIGVDLRM